MPSKRKKQPSPNYWNFLRAALIAALLLTSFVPIFAGGEVKAKESEGFTELLICTSNGMVTLKTGKDKEPKPVNHCQLCFLPGDSLALAQAGAAFSHYHYAVAARAWWRQAHAAALHSAAANARPRAPPAA